MASISTHENPLARSTESLPFKGAAEVAGNSLHPDPKLPYCIVIFREDQRC